MLFFVRTFKAVQPNTKTNMLVHIAALHTTSSLTAVFNFFQKTVMLVLPSCVRINNRSGMPESGYKDESRMITLNDLADKILHYTCDVLMEMVLTNFPFPVK